MTLAVTTTIRGDLPGERLSRTEVHEVSTTEEAERLADEARKAEPSALAIYCLLQTEDGGVEL